MQELWRSAFDLTHTAWPSEEVQHGQPPHFTPFRPFSRIDVFRYILYLWHREKPINLLRICGEWRVQRPLLGLGVSDSNAAAEEQLLARFFQRRHWAVLSGHVSDYLRRRRACVASPREFASVYFLVGNDNNFTGCVCYERHQNFSSERSNSKNQLLWAKWGRDKWQRASTSIFRNHWCLPF